MCFSLIFVTDTYFYVDTTHINSDHLYFFDIILYLPSSIFIILFKYVCGNATKLFNIPI